MPREAYDKTLELVNAFVYRPCGPWKNNFLCFIAVQTGACKPSSRTCGAWDLPITSHPIRWAVSQPGGSRVTGCAPPSDATYFRFLHKTQESRGLSRRRLRRERKRFPRSVPEAVGDGMWATPEQAGLMAVSPALWSYRVMAALNLEQKADSRRKS